MAQNEHETALAVIDSTPQYPTTLGMVRPLVDPHAAQAAIAEYEALKAAIVRPGDIQKIQGRDFLKKSFWRRVATCFGLSLDLVSEERIIRENGALAYSVIYRAIAPNGRTMTADGYCDTAEKRGVPEHNIRAIAHTRAKNRAISDLVGGGEVSAEEMADYVDSYVVETQQPARQPQTARQQATQPARGQTWAQVRQDAIAKGLATQEQWDEFCQRTCGKTEKQIIDSKDAGAKAMVAQAVAAYVAEDALVGLPVTRGN